ncbi:MAG TPA: hypothetical protein DEQ20_01575 [Desulfobulbaceae bacterium]|nr:MAG: hypothetical protein A2520_04190 [Deltaproteobacteria bacterium RIFOXYD12_FULL_53_23]HCC53607.1 hypothetical protein [Desulfobulbaceae bacterium]
MARITVILTTFLLLAHTACANAEPLGRLFFNPDERARLDQIRNGKITDNTQPNFAPPPAAQTTLNGFVRRNNGKTTVWINQIPQDEDERQGSKARKSSAKSPDVSMKLPSGKKVRIKPGQTFDSFTGKVKEGYEDIAIPAPLPAEVLQ